MNVTIEPVEGATTFLPEYATAGSAGADVRTPHAVTIYPDKPTLIALGFKIQVPEGHFAAIYPRSGLAVKKGVNLINGVAVVDSDYRGEVKVPLVAQTGQSVHIQAGDRIAQVVIQPYVRADFSYGQVDDTERGEGGFGSTGSQ